jgi:hypothetical protein
MFQIIKQAYGEEVLNHSAVFKWHKHFQQGRYSLEVEHTIRSGMVRNELRIQEVAMLMHANHSKMVDEVAAAGIAMVLASKSYLMT